MALKRIVAKRKPLDSISMAKNENIYDDLCFSEQYSKMNSSQKGLSDVGEWHTFQKMLPDFEGKIVLDLGCGFGWHCRYAVDNRAASVIGVDISERRRLTVIQKFNVSKMRLMMLNLHQINLILF